MGGGGWFDASSAVAVVDVTTDVVGLVHFFLDGFGGGVEFSLEVVEVIHDEANNCEGQITVHIYWNQLARYGVSFAYRVLYLYFA